MITKETLKQLRQKRLKSPNFVSEPQPLFVNGKFNLDNWNGGDDIIRNFTYSLELDNPQLLEFEEDDINYTILCDYHWIEDMKYIVITVVRDCYDSNGDVIEYVDVYVIIYYKNRGTTDYIYKNGKLISEDEYIELLNLIERGGYKFEY